MCSHENILTNNQLIFVRFIIIGDMTKDERVRLAVIVQNQYFGNIIIGMKNFFQQENQENIQKKTRKHYGKQYSKRPWKTPSPSLNAELKSPRFVRNGFKDTKQKTKGRERQKVNDKIEEQIDEYAMNSKHSIKGKFGTVNNHSQDHHLKVEFNLGVKQLKKSMTEQSTISHNHYFNKPTITMKEAQQKKSHSRSHFRLNNNHNGIENDKTTPKGTQSSHSLNKLTLLAKYKNSIKQSSSQDESESLGASYNLNKHKTKPSSSHHLANHHPTTKFQQTIRRYSKQNQKLKKQLHDYKSEVDKLRKQKDQTIKECDRYQTQVTELGLKIYELKQQIYRYQICSKKAKKTNSKSSDDFAFLLEEKEKIYGKKIEELQKMLENSEKQLNLSNLEIYNMKQEIFELQVENQKLSHTSNHPFPTQRHTVDDQTPKRPYNQPSNSLSNSPSKSIIEKPSGIQESSDPKEALTKENRSISTKQCYQCGIKQQNISYMTKILENKMYDLMKKENIINSFIQQIKNLENQIKLLEKPKNIYRKFNNIVGQLNQQIVRSKLSELNRKYQENEERSNTPKKKMGKTENTYKNG